MRALHIAEIRGSWRAWLSVSLAFLVTNFGIALPALLVYASWQGDVEMGTHFLIVTNVILVALVAMSVLANSAELVVASRRGAIARLALAGASPNQIVRTLMTQLVAVTLACAVVGDAIAVAVQQPVITFVQQDRAAEGTIQLVPTYSPLPLLFATALCVAVALLAGLRVARRATRIPAVEALRQAANEPEVTGIRGRAIRFGLLLLVLVLLAAGSLYSFGQNDLQKGDQILQAGVILLVLTGWAISVGAPLFMRGLVRAWTRLIPNTSPAWHLARHTVVARSTRMIKTILPVMMAVGILVGMLVLGATMTELIRMANGGEVGDTRSSLGTMMTILGLPFLVSLSGAVGNLIMMARQRDAEMALTSIAGGTPDQQRGALILEGVIVGVTGMILGLVMVVVAMVYTYVGLMLYLPIAAVAVPWGSMGLVVVVCLAVCVLATLLPSIPALRLPPQKVVARLISD